MSLTVFAIATPLLTRFLWTFGTLAVIGGLGWLLVRFGAPRLGQLRSGRRMRIVEKLPLEPGRSLVLVELDGKTLLFGVAPGQISLLTPDPVRAKDSPHD